MRFFASFRKCYKVDIIDGIVDETRQYGKNNNDLKCGACPHFKSLFLYTFVEYTIL